MCKVKKIDARNALAISRVAFAGVMQIEGGTIRVCTAAFGAVMDVTLVRLKLMRCSWRKA